jgi:hypothetical protein
MKSLKFQLLQLNIKNKIHIEVRTAFLPFVSKLLDINTQERNAKIPKGNIK